MVMPFAGHFDSFLPFLPDLLFSIYRSGKCTFISPESWHGDGDCLAADMFSVSNSWIFTRGVNFLVTALNTVVRHSALISSHHCGVRHQRPISWCGVDACPPHKLSHNLVDW